MQNLFNKTENINIYLKLNKDYLKKIHEIYLENFKIYFSQLKNKNEKTF